MAYVSGSSADGLVIGAGDDSLEVISGGVVTNTAIVGNGFGTIDSGGTAENTDVGGVSGYLAIEDGGQSTGTQVASGGTEELDGGGADGTVVGPDGIQIIVTGSAVSTQVSGGLQEPIAGVTDGATISAGGVQFDGLTDIFVVKGAAEVDGTVVGSGGTQVLVSQGPSLTLTSAGSLFATLTSGGNVVTLSYGPDAGSGAAGESIREVEVGGEVYATDIAADGTVLGTASAAGFIALPAIVTDTTVLSGGTVQFLGGTATGLVAEPGATELIGGSFTISGIVVTTSPVSVTGNVVGNGVTEIVESNGTAISSTIQSGGTEYISSGGTASGTTVLSGGLLYIESGGTVSGGAISAGGVEYIVSGATATGVHVQSGGGQYDLAGGTDDGATVHAGGTLYVFSGGSVSNLTDSGTEVILSGGSGGGIKIDNSGVLSFSDSEATGANTVYAGGVTVFTGSATAATASFDVFASAGALVSSALNASSGSTVPFPRFQAATFASAGVGAVLFQDSSTAAGATIHVGSGGVAWFEDASTAGSASITLTSGLIGFTNGATAGGAAIEIDGAGAGVFIHSSTAGSATLTLSATATSGGVLLFGNSATAGNATIDNIPTNGDVGGLIVFASGSTAGGVTINNQARTTTDLSRAIATITQEVISHQSTPEIAAYKAEQAVAQFPGQSAAPIGGLVFFDGSTAGSATINNTSNGLTEFFNDGAPVGSPTITNSGSGSAGGVTLFISANAGTASITDEYGGSTVFGDHGDGGTATITNQSGGLLGLGDGASLGSAQIDNQGALIALGGTAGAAQITNGGVILFGGDSTAGHAAITLTASAVLGFIGNGDGGTAQVTTTGATAQIDLSAVTTSAVGIGSVAGPGLLALGGNKLVVGAANTDSTVTGIVTNGGIVNSVTGISFPDVRTVGGEATLDKIGTGTLTLSGTVNQTNLIVARGTLAVDGAITGSSTATIQTSGTLELGAATSESVIFAAGGGTLVLDDPASYTGAVAGFSAGETIVLGVPAASGASAAITPSASGAAIQVSDGGQSFTVALADAALAGRTLAVGVTSAGQLALTLSGQIVSTAIQVGSGQTLTGAVVISGGSITVQDGGTLSGTLVNKGGAIDVQSGGAASGNVINDGAIENVDDGATSRDSYVTDPGQQTVAAGGLSLGAQVSGGVQTVFGTANLASVASGGVQIAEAGGTVSATLIGPGGTLDLSGGSASRIAVSIGGALDFTSLPFVQGATATVDPSTDLLTLNDGASQTLQLAGDYSAEAFHVAGDGAAGTLVSAIGVACYCPGTAIATPSGETAIEALAIGDLVLTHDGRAEPVRWIGRRAYAGRFLAANPGVQPVRFTAGALGGGLPRRDLLVSPDHAMLLDGLLVPARHLVNGRTIRQERRLAAVHYIHLELAAHEAILAEGAPSETFIDDSSRMLFHNAAEHRRLYPEDRATDPAYCAPRVTNGYALEAIRRRLGAQPAAA